MPAVGTLAISYDESLDRVRWPVRKVTFDWTSDASGDVNGTPTLKLSGTIMRVVFNPGSPAPTAGHNITLLDENLLDVLAGQGSTLSATATTNVKPGIPLKDGTTVNVSPTVVNDVLSLVVAGAGASKQGQVVVYLR